MREIKFRAWDKVHKEFLKIDGHMGCFLWGGEEYAIPPDRKASSGVSLVSPCQPDKGQDYFGCMSSTFFGDDVILMQYTGLKDKNGKEIYEGDIIELAHTEQSGSRITGLVVEYLVNMSGFYLMKNGEGCHLSHSQTVLNGKVKHLEIIGNIYENPELLK